MSQTPPAPGWLAVQAGGQSLLLPLTQCGEIHTTSLVQRLPHTRPWLLGVANLRGQVVTVVDLAGYLGLPAVALPHDAACGPLIALPTDLGVPAALLVGALKGMRQPGTMQPAEAAEPPAWATCAWRDEAAQTWLGVDIAQMTRQLRFIDVTAG